MNSVIHFEVPFDDESRATKFYGDIFGWQLQSIPEMNYVMASTTESDDKGLPKNPGAINGGMTKRGGMVNAVNIVIGVDDIDGTLEKIKTKGGSVVQAKMPVGDMGFAAYFKDTEGNVLGIWQNPS